MDTFLGIKMHYLLEKYPKRCYSGNYHYHFTRKGIKYGLSSGKWICEIEAQGAWIIYTFVYDKTYLEYKNAEPISLKLPLTDEPFVSNILHPFFDGPIPEDWLLDIVEKNWKIIYNQADRPRQERR